MLQTQIGVPVLMLDLNSHCLKKCKCGSWKCVCALEDVPASQRARFQDRRVSSCLGILGVKSFDLEVLSMSLMGAQVGWALLTDGKPAAQLSNIIGPDVLIKFSRGVVCMNCRPHLC